MDEFFVSTMLGLTASFFMNPIATLPVILLVGTVYGLYTMIYYYYEDFYNERKEDV